MKFVLELDNETIARLEEIGKGRASSQSLEILGMELIDAYQASKAEKLRVKASRFAGKRKTFKNLVVFARTLCISVERSGREILFWRLGSSDKVNAAPSVAQAWEEIEGL